MADRSTERSTDRSTERSIHLQETDMFKKTLVCATLVLSAGVAMAQGSARIDERQARQDARIDQGVASGQLTQREAARMEAGQARVQGMENRALSDGTVTGRERARIEHAQDVQSARIHRQKHDRQHDVNHNGRVDRRRGN